MLRDGGDCTVVALGLMVPRALAAAERLAAEGIEATVIDLRSLVPLDVAAVLASVARDGPAVHGRGEPAACGWGAEIASIVADEVFWNLDGPIVRITTPHLPLPSAGELEDLAIPSVERVAATIRESLG